MASTTDATYQPKVYRTQGGDGLVVASGGSLSLQSGSSVQIETPIEMASGTYVKKTVTTRAKTAVATAIPLGCICGIDASTTTPEYKLATPVAGAEIVVTLVAQTSNVGAAVYSGSTGIAMATSGANKITLVGLNQTAIFHAASATRWYVTKNTSIAFGTHTT